MGLILQSRVNLKTEPALSTVERFCGCCLENQVTVKKKIQSFKNFKYCIL